MTIRVVTNHVGYGFSEDGFGIAEKNTDTVVSNGGITFSSKLTYASFLIVS